MDDVELEVKALIKAAIWEVMVLPGKGKHVTNDFKSFDELLDAMSDKVYESIWEYLADFD